MICMPLRRINYKVFKCNVAIKKGGFYSGLIRVYLCAFLSPSVPLFWCVCNVKRNEWYFVKCVFCMPMFTIEYFVNRFYFACILRMVLLSGKQSVFQIGVLHHIQASKDIMKSVQNIYFESDVLTTLYILHFICHHVTQSVALWILYSSVFVPSWLAS